mmetsp:Transcript_68361/g.130114  ORF Transcript_68361/g.130114 Transcript_68361/m.130114 type:complete len:102 (+) Transcript_68361:288-593(+)
MGLSPLKRDCKARRRRLKPVSTFAGRAPITAVAMRPPSRRPAGIKFKALIRTPQNPIRARGCSETKELVVAGSRIFASDPKSHDDLRKLTGATGFSVEGGT